MSTALPDPVKERLDGTVFATLATLNPDGHPQLSVVWVGRDGDDVIVSTTTNRQKYRNLTRDPRATLSFFLPEAPYKYAEIRGSVVLEDVGSTEVIDSFARKYMGWDRYTLDDGTDNVRVNLRLRPDHVVF